MQLRAEDRELIVSPAEQFRRIREIRERFANATVRVTKPVGPPGPPPPPYGSNIWPGYDWFDPNRYNNLTVKFDYIPTGRHVTSDDVSRIVEELTGYDKEAICSMRRFADLMLARKLAYYLTVKFCRYSTSQVALRYRRIDPSTAQEAIHAIERLLYLGGDGVDIVRAAIDRCLEIRDKVGLFPRLSYKTTMTWSAPVIPERER